MSSLCSVCNSYPCPGCTSRYIDDVIRLKAELAASTRECTELRKDDEVKQKWGVWPTLRNESATPAHVFDSSEEAHAYFERTYDQSHWVATIAPIVVANPSPPLRPRTE